MNELAKKALSIPAIKRAVFSLLRKPGRPLYLGVCVHTEKVQDAEVFAKLLELGRALPFKASACVMTPANPFVRAEMERLGVSEADFAGRLKELSKFFEIGYHGHWCRGGGGSTRARTEIERAGFGLTLGDAGAVREQFLAEHAWLSANLYPPKAYSAGWWFMNSAVAGLLDGHGFGTDCSLRRGRPDSFGGEYLAETLMPENGTPFILPGTGGVLELPSLFYLHMNWWTVLKDLFPLLARTGGPYFAVLPTHDYNLKQDLEKVLENVRLLAGLPGVRFAPLSGMKELASAAGPVFGSAGFAPAACPACGAAPSETVWRERALRAAECSSCGLIRLDPRPPGVAETYGEAYYANNYLPKAAPRLAFFERRLAEIERLAPGKGAALDVGCGVGFFLKKAAERGWTARGVEPSEFAAAYARKEFGLDVSRELPAAGAFDLVTLWDVIAHLEDPGAALDRLAGLAKDGALLAVATPVRPRWTFRFASFVSRFVTSAYYLHAPQQLFHFSRASLENLLRRRGFTPVSGEYLDLAVKTGLLSVFRGGPREIASGLLHYIADRGHYRDYLVVYARKEKA